MSLHEIEIDKFNEVREESIVIHLPDEVDNPSYTTAEVSGEIFWRGQMFSIRQIVTLKLDRQELRL